MSVNNDWIKDLQNGAAHGGLGHHFYECYLSEKLGLVDPINNKIVDKNYDRTNSNITNAHEHKYYVYAKCSNLFEIDECLPKKEIKLKHIINQ